MLTRDQLLLKNKELQGIFKNFLDIQNGKKNLCEIKNLYEASILYRLHPMSIYIDSHYSSLKEIVSPGTLKLYDQLRTENAYFFDRRREVYNDYICKCPLEYISSQFNSFMGFANVLNEIRQAKDDKLELECLHSLQVLLIEICMGYENEFRTFLTGGDLNAYNLLYEKLRLLEEIIKKSNNSGEYPLLALGKKYKVNKEKTVN